MSKNEYRRAFIMLRPAMPGVSGHARLERRTMTGSLYFIVSGPGEGWQAALVGSRSLPGQGDFPRQTGREYYAAALGELKRDARGQQTLARAFDPRNIGGRPLEAYPLVVVARVDAQGCQVALTGNVEGAFPMDPAGVQEAVCALYASQNPAADLPAPEEAIPQSEAISNPESAPVSEAAPQPEAISNPESMPEPEAIPAPEIASEPQPDPATTPELTFEPQPGPVPESEDTTEPKAASEPLSDPEPDAARTKIYTRMRAPEAADPAPVPLTVAEAEPPGRTAIDVAWCVQGAAPCAMPLEDGFAYIRMPLPAACGTPYCMLGVKARDSRIISVRCAVPGNYSPAPPRGLEGSVWLGAGDGEGYWVFTVPCETGD